MAQDSNPSKTPGDSLVRDYMTVDPQTLSIEHSLLDAVLMLRRSNLRHIPILEDGHLVGLLSDRDISRLAPSLLVPLSAEDYNRVFEDTRVGKIMTRNPLCIAPGALLSEAVEALDSNRLGCLPVLDDGRLVGIITVSDMLRALRDLISGTTSDTPTPEDLPGE